MGFNHKSIAVEGMVSVVIPTYNQEGFIGDTIDSVLNQSYPNVEIIITDDGSADNTANIIKSYATKYYPKIIPLLNIENVGIAENLNRALAHVRGEYIAWLGGDDLMLPQKLERQVEVLKKRRDAAGCCHDAEVFASSSGQIIGSFSELYNGQPGLKEGGVDLWFDTDYHMLPSTVMIRSTAVPERGFDKRLRYVNDWLFDIEVFRLGKCVPINETLARYRRHDKNVSSSQQAKVVNTEEALIALAIIDARYPDLYRFVKKHRRILVASAFLNSYRLGDKESATGYLCMLFGSVGRLLAPPIWVALHIIGPTLAGQSQLVRHQRSRTFQEFVKIAKGLL